MLTPALALSRRVGPGILLSLVVAIAAVLAEPALKAGLGWSLPAMVIALLIGIALFPLSARPSIEPGITWCVKKLLRIAIGLLGVRIALQDIWALGPMIAALIVVSMAATLVAGILVARGLKLDEGYGALAGAATAVCGASATLATATVVPNYTNKARDVAFTVIAANAVSTLVMLAYPPLGQALGLDPQALGILLGATIHDMAQVVGAGYAVSEPVGNTAVIVKLFRVFLLLPVVLAIGWWFAARAASDGSAVAQVPVPVFALAFLGLAVLNSILPSVPALAPLYATIKPWIVLASTWGLLISIAALGLGTSIKAILAVGWRHVLLFSATTLLLLTLVAATLLMLK